ncbi:MAG TPA: hypothetical protein VJP86_04720, partial [Vicinamibacterales bacterium]|nr:hypothetical protein [Vicinamibacterales bacterium]
PPVRISPLVWVAMLGPALYVEYITGIYNAFPLVYVIPVTLAAYYSGRWAALMLAVTIPIAHLAFTLIEQPAANLGSLVATTALRSSVVIFMALWFARLSEHERALRQEVQTLKGLLPICLFCKSIRNDAGEWERLEGFISRRSQTEFSHGICPSCHQTHYASLSGHSRLDAKPL